MLKSLLISLVVVAGAFTLAKLFEKNSVVPNTKNLQNLSVPSSVPSPGIAIGIYQPQQDTSGKAIDRYISEVGRKPAFAWLPTNWRHIDGRYQKFYPSMLEEFRIRGIMPGMTWGPSKGSTESYADRQEAINQTEFSWKEIASGRHDEYLTQFAKDAAAYNFPFLLRPLHEMDGTWYPWGYSVNGNTNPADFVAAWKFSVRKTPQMSSLSGVRALSMPI